MQLYRLGELFCGPGGLGLGAKNASLRHSGSKISTQWAIDNDVDACATYQYNLCPGAAEKVICGDVRNIDISNLPPIDALSFGFPCNDFSIVGEQRGFEGEYGPLYSYGVEVINTFKPKWFLAENVSGLQGANEGKAFQKILNDLEVAGNGYDLNVHYYKFEEYGVPQARHRIIIVGFQKDLNIQYHVPAPTHKSNYVSARQALEVPPIGNNAPNHELTKQSHVVVERLKHIKPGENAWNADIPEDLQLNVKGAKISQIYRRLHPDKPAYTVTGSGGGGTHVYHWAEPRALTNRERARLQSFPDDFVFRGSKEKVRKQIGMAVPPLVAQIIFDSILKTLAGIEYDRLDSPNKGDSLPLLQQLSFSLL